MSQEMVVNFILDKCFRRLCYPKIILSKSLNVITHFATKMKNWWKELGKTSKLFK
jgi:hypothetical protein